MTASNQLLNYSLSLYHSLRPAFVGLSTLIPGVNTLRARLRGTGIRGDNARYFYSIWLRHAVLLAQHGAQLKGARVAELGPGSSLGIGLASLLTGVASYTALDVVKYTDRSSNHQMLNQLADLFAKREPIPCASEFPGLEPLLDDYGFPVTLFPDAELNNLTSRTRRLHEVLDTCNDEILEYCVPWNDLNARKSESIDIILSQAVLQSVDDLAETYEAMHTLLKPGGLMSHSIDFGSLRLARTWDGHRAYGDLWWAIIKGRRPHSLNRLPLSAHLELLNQNGFETLSVQTVTDVPSLSRRNLASRFQKLDDRDIETRTTVIVARKSDI